jgi:hypothetical protein
VYAIQALAANNDEIRSPVVGFMNDLLVRCADSHAAGARYLRINDSVPHGMQPFQDSVLSFLDFERSIARGKVDLRLGGKGRQLKNVQYDYRTSGELC